MTRFALLFPGQGAQFPGMAQRLDERSARVRDLFDLAERCTALPLRRICFHTDRGDQARTDWTQAAVFVASLATWFAAMEYAEQRGRPVQPACVAGHSLGHFTALVAARAVDLATGLVLVHRRARLMYQANQRQPGRMATLVGLSVEQVRGLLAATVGDRVAVGAVNGLDQVVVSGTPDALDEVTAAARQAGAERVVPLHIGLAAHSPLMREAAEAFAADVSALPLHRPSCPVVLNTTATPTDDVAEIRQDLLAHMCAPVQWWGCVVQAREQGRTRLVDGGPGRTLTKMLRRDLPEAELYALDQPRGPEGLLG